jgi:ribosomal protein L17
MGTGRRRLNRPASERRLLLRSLVTELIKHERIRTTYPRAKEIQPIAEKMITLGKKNTQLAERRAAAYLTRYDMVRKLFDELAPRFFSERCGYTRVKKVGRRIGDRAEMAIVEYLYPERGPQYWEKKRNPLLDLDEEDPNIQKSTLRIQAERLAKRAAKIAAKFRGKKATAKIQAQAKQKVLQTSAVTQHEEAEDKEQQSPDKK